jgi:isoleucyl-tRNA synthetase
MAEFIPATQLIEGLSAEVLEKLKNWDVLKAIRAEVLKPLEKARKDKFIGNALEAKVIIAPQGAPAEVLRQYLDFLPSLFIVSQVELGGISGNEAYSAETDDLKIAVVHADGEKCERCWNYSTRTVSYQDFPPVCPKCTAALKEMGI